MRHRLEGAGKGDNDRTNNKKQFDKNYDQIVWDSDKCVLCKGSKTAWIVDNDHSTLLAPDAVPGTEYLKAVDCPVCNGTGKRNQNNGR